jgi:hypothetical protein
VGGDHQFVKSDVSPSRLRLVVADGEREILSQKV